MKKQKNTEAVLVTADNIAPTWKDESFTPALIKLRDVDPTLNEVGKILYFHQLAMEAGRVSIAAALMVALELHKIRNQHPTDWIAWCDANLKTKDVPFGYRTANRYLNALEKTLGKTMNLYLLSNDSDEAKIEAVAKFTKYTNYQSLYQVYQGEGIVAKSKLGGKREGAGAPKKTDGEKIDDAAQRPALLFAEFNGNVTALWRLACAEKVLERFVDEDLARFSGLLKEVYQATLDELKRRVK